MSSDLRSQSQSRHSGAARLLPERGRGCHGQGADPIQGRISADPGNAWNRGVELSEEAETLYPAKERGSTAAFCSFDGVVKDW